VFDEDDFQEEIRSHLEIAARERMADGADPKSARLASLKEFGNVTLTTEAARRVWMPRWVDAVRDELREIRHALRALAKNPVFSLTVVAVLTIGIGANAAVFTMLKSMALAPLSGIANSSQLAVIVNQTEKGRTNGLSYHDYKTVREHDTAFSGVSATAIAVLNFGRGRGARPLYAELVSGNYFQTLGVHAEQGRTLLPSDEIAPGRHPYVVLNDGFWRRDFGADPGIVGRTIEFNNFPLTVVGVADPTFHGTIVGYDVEAFIPLMMAPQLSLNLGSLQENPATLLADRGIGAFDVLGFLRPGVTFGAARGQIASLSTALAREAPTTASGQRLTLVRIWNSPYGAQTYLMPVLIVLAGMGLLVLAIACANIAGLVLVRGLSRRGDIAVRLALGASRARVVRMLVLENLLLAIPGAVFGVALASWAMPQLVGTATAMAAPMRMFFNNEVDRLVIAFATLAGCGSALVFGFLPALQTSRIDLITVINEDASPRGAARGRLRASLVVAQVAVSLLLLVGSGLVSRSVAAARQTYPGFDRRQVAIVAVDLKANGYDAARGRVFYRHLIDTLREQPEIESVSIASSTPLNLVGTRTVHVAVDGYTARSDEDLSFEVNTIAPDYFRTLRVPLASGRAFEDRDDPSGAPVLMVNETFARKFYGDPSTAVGKRVRLGTDDWRTVVGVARDLKYSRLDEAPRPFVYVPFFQAYRSSMIVHVRSAMATNALIDLMRARVEALDPDLPIINAKPLASDLRGATILLEFASAVLFIFGLAGIVLAALGTYGLVSYVVHQSTHEIGIRMALGASAVSVVRRFVTRGLQLGAVGAVVGVVVAFAGARLVQGVLFNVSPLDAVSYARALAVVIAGVAVATLVPAWRASRTDPLAALRHQ
jgi:predicted permease